MINQSIFVVFIFYNFEAEQPGYLTCKFIQDKLILNLIPLSAIL